MTVREKDSSAISRSTTFAPRSWPRAGQFPDMRFRQGYRPGEMRQCIVLNWFEDAFLENVVLDNVHVTYGGGGTAEEAQREIPQIAGEYFEIGTPPAYGLYARKVRGLTLNNVRFEVEQARSASGDSSRPRIRCDDQQPGSPR